ncbi:uncharacterized protein LOC142168276 [Nicotiana tabacum]|uniref:Uncharacterized protein LOC142168276 n=1 Tax=Nicotiana tabacum TaxID=4097 RepID=A0AC58SJB3_TOBAC
MLADELKRLDKFTKLHPPYFSGTSLEDAHGFLESYHEILCNLELVESNRVGFTAFQMQGPAKRWCQDYELGRPAGSPPLTWAQFYRVFLENFMPHTRRKEIRRQYLQQGPRSVTEYEMRFIKLSHHATFFIPTKEESVRRFIDGLQYGIHIVLARVKDRDFISLGCRDSASYKVHLH